MNKFLNFFFITVAAFFAFTACSEKDNGENDGQPTIELTKVSEVKDALVFKVNAENSVDFAYLVKEGYPASNVSANEIFTAGTVAAVEDIEYRAEGLDAFKQYTVYAAARNRKGEFSKVAKMTGYTGICSFDVTVDPAKIKHVSCEIVVMVSDPNVSYFIASYPTQLVQDMKLQNDDDIHNFIIRRMKQAASDAGVSFEEALSQSLLMGNIQAELSGMAENADNEIYVYAMNTEGERQSSIVNVHVKTNERAMVDLKIELSAELLSATKAHIKAVPSDANAPYCLLGFMKEEYPNASTAKEYAEAIVKQWQGWLDNGVMINKGVVENKNFDVIPGKEYVLCAFGYDKGINSEAYMIEFKGGEAGDPEKATFSLELDKAYSTSVRFNTNCSDQSVYYMVHLVPSAQMSDEVIANAKLEIEDQIIYYLEMQQEFNPGYQLSQAIADVCLSGYREGLSINGVNSGETYTAFMYGVTIEGKAAKNTQIFDDFVTIPVFNPSNAKYTTDFFKYFDGNDIEEEAPYIFEDVDKTDQVIAVVKNQVNEDVVKAYYAIYMGNPFGDQGDDYIIDACQWNEFSEKDGVVTEYGFYLLGGYNMEYVVFTVGKDANGEFGPVGKTVLNATSYDMCSPVSELEEIVGMSQNQARIPYCYEMEEEPELYKGMLIDRR